MKIVNGKLIDYNQDRIEEIDRELTQVTQRCQDLESQVTTIGKQDYGRYFQKLDRRIDTLEKMLSKHNKELLILKLSLIFCLVSLGLVFSFKGGSTPDRVDRHQSQNLQLKPPSSSKQRK
jgi:hypothetical protein